MPGMKRVTGLFNARLGQGRNPAIEQARVKLHFSRNHGDGASHGGPWLGMRVVRWNFQGNAVRRLGRVEQYDCGRRQVWGHGKVIDRRRGVNGG